MASEPPDSVAASKSAATMDVTRDFSVSVFMECS